MNKPDSLFFSKEHNPISVVKLIISQWNQIDKDIYWQSMEKARAGISKRVVKEGFLYNLILIDR